MVAQAFLGPVGGLIGSVVHAVVGVVLGGLHWTVGVAGKFILATIAGLVRLLIPASWAHDGLEVMHWIVAVPNYAGTITTPSGATVYGFGGVNSLRDLFMWIGAALLPLTLVYATSRAAFGAGGHPAAPVMRVLALAALLASYPWWWSRGAAAVNQLTGFVLGLPAVSHGVYKLMQYAVGGVALGGWQLIDLFLMGAIGVALLGLIFLKVVIILLGALIYAIGPMMIALVPTEGGTVIARAWASAAVMLIALPLGWSTILAVGAVLVDDSSTAGPLIAGAGTVAQLLGGLLLALAGLASLWLCIRVAREAGGVLRGQLAGVLAFGGGRRASTGSTTPPTARRAADSLRGFPGRVASATGAALAAAGPAGQTVRSGAAGLAAHSRHGLIGTGASLARTGAAAAAPPAAALVGRTRAGAVAVRMARAGTASWRQSAQPGPHPAQPRIASFHSTVHRPAAASTPAGTGPAVAQEPPAPPRPRGESGGAPGPLRGSHAAAPARVSQPQPPAAQTPRPSSQRASNATAPRREPAPPKPPSSRRPHGRRSKGKGS